MARGKTIARRAFLIGSVTVAGGVAFGIWRHATPYDNPLLDDLPDGAAALTPYVRITGEAITLITPRADVGQGAVSVQAMLIAEELDVDPAQVATEFGPPDRAYWNTALSEEAVPFRATDRGWLAETARDVMDAPMKFLGMQITGGSTTVPDGYEKLRRAGAVARETLKATAARLHGVERAALRTEGGAVILPDGTRLSYESLAAEAAHTEPVTDVRLRDPDEWRLVGTPVQRLDIVAKSTGTQDYGIDEDQPGMLHAAIRLNPGHGGALRGYDAAGAGGMRGVTRIVELPGGVGIIADNTWRAMRAAEAIACDWAPAPYPAGMDGHWQTLADSFTPDRQDSRLRDEGDVAAALAEGADVEVEYRAPYLAHAPLEPLNATVRYTAERTDIWTGTQVPRFVQGNAAAITGQDAGDVHVHVRVAGGSFGHRLEDTVVQHATRLAMAVPGTPVKLTYAREQDMGQEYPRQIAMARGRGRVSGGRVTAYDLGIAMPSILTSQMGRQAIPTPGPDLQIVAGAWDQPFAVPDYRVTGYRAPELAPVSSWRSVGASTNGFFHDCLLDELIHAAGADPLEERLRLCHHAPSRAVLAAVGEMSGWGGSMGPGEGRGVAFCLSFGVPCAQVVEVRDTGDGIRITRVWVAADVGRIVDPVNFEAQMQGGVVWGLGHAMHGALTYTEGAVEQRNFDTFRSMRLHECPEIVVRGLETAAKVRGIGEPPVPPAAPALANAIFAATGTRLREMPFDRRVSFAG
ncbi:xanthine dehydrogenase family protein molybdopterin-binding subunit [Roseovarius ramblicola]|uniref:Molybdopterin cofactor-binding domain-containing protein n=1 Tax=Roseovarius ramblicola TaxID=2022336 RepID=A0ABV5I1X1_9RHOB